MARNKQKHCYCGKRYFKTMQDAKKFRYYLGNTRKLNPVMYYKCEYNSWHWSQSYFKDKNSLDIRNLGDFSQKRSVKVSKMLNHYTLTEKTT